jgi:hypothetical protein
MEVKCFTADDLCKIIKECAKSGVKTFKVQDEVSTTISLEFDVPENDFDNLSPSQARARKGAFPAPKNMSEVKEVEALSEQLEMFDKEQERIDNLLLENPLQYEEELARGAIEYDSEQEG